MDVGLVAAVLAICISSWVLLNRPKVPKAPAPNADQTFVEAIARLQEKAAETLRIKVSEERDQAVAAMIHQIATAVGKLVESREPTLDEMRDYCTKRQLWCGRPGDMIKTLNENGHVVLTEAAWKEVTDRLTPPPDGGRQAWIDREE